MFGSMFNLQMPARKFEGLPPPQKKKWGGRDELNLARFRTPSHFELEYLQNGQRYPKSENLVHDIFSRVRRKKLGELWSTNYGD